MKVAQVALVLSIILVAEMQADTFGTGANQFTIEFVNIGYAGNMADATGYGTVGYDYRIGKHEVTIDQFTKAYAVDSKIGNGNEGYWNNGSHTVGTDGPASHTSWYEAAKFSNWLTSGDAHTGVYQFNSSGTLTGIDRSYRNSNDIAYVLPSEDEWYKAAYHKSDGTGYTLYATGNEPPTNGVAANWYANAAWQVGSGSSENNATFDMNGNVWEWNESAWDGTLDDMAEDRVYRGGSMYDELQYLRSDNRYHNFAPTREYDNLGFRVAAIPEPGVLSFIGIFCGGAVFIRRFFIV